MGGAGEEIERLEMCDVIFLLEDCDIASLSGGVAGEVDDGRRIDLEKFIEEFGMATGTGWIEDDGGVAGDKVERVLRFR